MSFKVKACGQALIAMSRVEGLTSRDTCEVRLGTYSNSKSEMVCDGPTVDTADTPDVLGCHEDRAFWIAWQGGVFRAGSGGQAFRNELLVYPHPNPHPVGGVSFATTGSDGIWTIHRLGGEPSWPCCSTNVVFRSFQRHWKH